MEDLMDPFDDRSLFFKDTPEFVGFTWILETDDWEVEAGETLGVVWDVVAVPVDLEAFEIFLVLVVFLDLDDSGFRLASNELTDQFLELSQVHWTSHIVLVWQFEGQWCTVYAQCFFQPQIQYKHHVW